MISLYLLLIVIPVAVIAYLVWDHKRKAAEREAVSAGRLQQIFEPIEQVRTARNDLSIGAASDNPVEATRNRAEYVRRERVLDPSRTLLYYLLRTALPDYVIFAQVALASVLEPSPQRAEHLRRETLASLDSRTVDFLVSDRNMQPLAVVQIVATTQASAATPSLESLLAAAGVRYIVFDAASLPRKDAIRGIILGDDTGAARAQSDAASHAT